MAVEDVGSGAERLRANEENVAAFFAHLRSAPGVDGEDRPAVRVATGIAHGFFNGVYVTRLRAAEVDAYLEETEAYFATRRLPWAWWVWPDPEPADLGDRLKARGLVPRMSTPAMSVELRELRTDWSWPEGLTVSRVADVDTLRAWTRVAGSALGLAPERQPRYVDVFASLGFAEDAPAQSYVGTVDGTPVGVSHSFVAGDVVGIYGVGTLAEHRGRGYGKALTVAALREAHGRGARWGTLQSTAMGLPVYERLGFRVDGDIRLFGRPPPAPSPS